MNTVAYPALLGDVGGTNARFAWCSAAGSPPIHIRTLACDHYPNLESVIRAYLQQTGLANPQSASIAIANPVTGDVVQMTNRDWSFSISALQKSLQLQKLRVLNDFTALALAIRGLPQSELFQIGGGLAVPNTAIGVLGAGTGLGVSGLIPCGNSWTPIQGEGGHVTLSASNETEFRIFELLAQQFGHVSAERILSGPGLVSLYGAVSQLQGSGVAPDISGADISDRALQQHEPLAMQTLELFAGLLGSVAGDLALTLGARGGVYIAGGIVPRWLGWFERSGFRDRFEAKGRFKSYLQSIPVWVVTTPDSPALAGAAVALELASEQ
ncbi:MAG: glucokinase [Pseudomonadota bacterium]